MGQLNDKCGFDFKPTQVASDHHVRRDETWMTFAGDTPWCEFEEGLNALPCYELFYDSDLYDRVRRLYERDLRQYRYSYPWPIPMA